MGNVIRLAKNKSITTWWETEVDVRWQAERHGGLPVLEAVGTILLRREDDEDEPSIEAGSVQVVKPLLWAGADCLLAMDSISGDYEALAGHVLDEQSYAQDFLDWFEVTFGVFATGDPVFVHDINIEGGYRNPTDPIAAYAVVDAVATFGSAASPIIGFGQDLVGEHVRDTCRDRGLWDWVDPLGARQWRGLLVAARPQPEAEDASPFDL